MINHDHLTLTSVSQMKGYNRWLVSRFLPYLGPTTIEVGAGIGTLARLYRHYTRPTLTDVNRGYVKTLKRKFPFPTYYFDAQRQLPQGLKKNFFSSIICSNVLEHVKNDESALRNIFSLLKHGGSLLLFVPAGQNIYGEIDRQLDHFRRYDKRELKQKLVAAGFKIKKIRYYNFVGYFSWWISSKLLGRPHIDRKSAAIFGRFFTPLLYLEELLPGLPFGQNLFVVAAKA